MSCHKHPSYLCQKQQYRRLNQSAVHSPITSSHPILLKSFPKNSPLNFPLQRRSTPSKTHKSCAALDSRHHLNFASFIHITLNIHTTNQNKTITSPRNKQDESTRLLSVTTTTTNIYYFYFYQPTATIGCLTHPKNQLLIIESRPRLVDSSVYVTQQRQHIHHGLLQRASCCKFTLFPHNHTPTNRTHTHT